LFKPFDEFYSANLAQDTMRGMKENIGRGFFNGGIVPFGYRKVKIPVNGSLIEAVDAYTQGSASRLA
jgi:hypothetical protein